jgi:hypothetical protein
MRRQRGTAIAEVAVVVSFTLIMLFGVLQFVLLGYYQLASDAAVFFGAHQYALGYTSMANLKTNGLFPTVIDPTSITFTPTVPNGFQTDEPVGFNLTSTTTRDGGTTIVIPQSLQASLTTSIKGLFTIIPAMNNVPVSSGSVEAFYQQAGGYYDAQGLAYNTGSAYSPGNLTNPLGNNHTTLDMNTPPYFAAQHFMIFCNRDGGASPGNINAFGYTCPAPRDIGIGIAEFLDNSNYTNPGGVGVDTSSQDVFQAMSCHQRIYTALLNAFPSGVTAQNLIDAHTVYQTNPKSPPGPAWPAIFSQGGAGPKDYDGYAGIEYSQPGLGHKWAQTLDSYQVPTGPWGGANLATVYAQDQYTITPSGSAPPFYPMNGCQTGEPGA